MIHGLEAHATFAGRMPATRKGETPSPRRLAPHGSALPESRVEIGLWVVYILPEHSFRDKMEMGAMHTLPICDWSDLQMKSIFDVSGKVIAITGGGGILCGTMARALAESGAKVAILDLIEIAAAKVAKEIRSAGGTALAVECNVLEKARQHRAGEGQGAGRVRPRRCADQRRRRQQEGGHHLRPRCRSSTCRPTALRFVFDLNFLGTMLPSQVFGKHMAEPGQPAHPQHLLDERLPPADQDRRRTPPPRPPSATSRSGSPCTCARTTRRTSASTPSRRASS